MLRAMFGMGGSEILVILIVALLFLGPDKLPDAAKKISKGIRDIKRQSRALQQTIEDDENIGGALRDLRSALRGEDAPPPPKPKLPKQIEAAATPDLVGPAAALAVATEAPEAGAAKDPHEHDAQVAATAFADTFESSHMASSAPTASAAPAADAPAEPPAPVITLPPTAGEPAESTLTASHADAELAKLVKPAPNTIARGSAASAAAASAAPSSEASASAAAATAPSSDAPSSAAPSSDAPSSDAPSSEASASAAPAAPAPRPSEPEHG